MDILSLKTMNSHRKKHRRRGVALVELALVLSILLALSMLIIQYAIIMNTAIALTNLSREGARFAAVNPATDTPILMYMDEICPPNLDWEDDIEGNVEIFIRYGTRNVGSKVPITVEITYDMSNKLFLPAQLRFPFMGRIQLFNTSYVASASMLIE